MGATSVDWDGREQFPTEETRLNSGWAIMITELVTIRMRGRKSGWYECGRPWDIL
jgi:hypothetical protein